MVVIDNQNENVTREKHIMNPSSVSCAVVPDSLQTHGL